MNVSVRPANMGTNKNPLYRTIQKELGKVLLEPSKWRTSAEDRKLREFPWKLCLKFVPEHPIPPPYFDLMRLSMSCSEGSLSRFVELFWI